MRSFSFPPKQSLLERIRRLILHQIRCRLMLTQHPCQILLHNINFVHSIQLQMNYYNDKTLINRQQYYFVIRRMIQMKSFEGIKLRYELLQELGRGATGICYHLKSRESLGHYVLKEIPLFICELNNLQSQIHILSKLDNPYIIKIHESFKTTQYSYLIFQYNHETDLQKIIKRYDKEGKVFIYRDVWKIFYQLLVALRYLHSLNIIHRDIKPNNIFVNQHSLQVKIGDLGSSKEVSSQDNYTRVGTPFYLSPEMLKYESHNEKVDIWSLGVSLYQMLTLRLPFHQKNLINLSSKICFTEPEYLCLKSSLFMEPLKDMLKKKAGQRLSAGELLQKYFINDIPIFNCNSEQQQLSSICDGGHFQSSGDVHFQELIQSVMDNRTKTRGTLFKTFTTEEEQEKEVILINQCEQNIRKVQIHKDHFQQQQQDIDPLEQTTILLLVKEASQKRYLTFKKDKSQCNQIGTQSLLKSNKTIVQTTTYNSKKTLAYLNKQKSAFMSHPSNTLQKQNQTPKNKHTRLLSTFGSHNNKHMKMLNNLKPKKSQKSEQTSPQHIQNMLFPQFCIIEHDYQRYSQYDE